MTVGICTSFAGPNLVETCQSINISARNIGAVLWIFADNVPISKQLKSELQGYGFEVRWRPGPGSYFKKARELIEATKTDILILTQDDIVFGPETLKEIVGEFKCHPKCTMLGIRILPLSPVTAFEHAMASMIRIVDGISGDWNKGDNYLAASGRCLAFRTFQLKKLKIPEVVNGDVYLFLANRENGGEFKRAQKAIVSIRAPQRMSDQLRPSSRFQYSRVEMEKYFGKDLSEVYRVPVWAVLRAYVNELCHHPIGALYYPIVFLTTRFLRKPAKEIMKTVWSADTSTKQIGRS